MTCIVCHQPVKPSDRWDGVPVHIRDGECLSEYLIIHHMLEQARKKDA